MFKKILLILIMMVLAPVLGLLFLKAIGAGDVFYENPLFHFLLFAIPCLVTFWGFYLAWSSYGRNQDANLFIMGLAFLVFGISFVVHATFTPHLFFVNHISPDFFDITEHYGLFFGSLISLGFVLPLRQASEKLFQYRKYILGFCVAIVSGFFAVTFKYPNISATASSYLEIATILTGVAFFISFVFLALQYFRFGNLLLAYFATGAGILVSVAILPFYYQEGNVLWWYFHFIFFVGFLVILIGLYRHRQSGLSTGVMFGDLSIRSRMVISLLAIIIIPIIASGYFYYKYFEKSLKDQTKESLIIFADKTEDRIMEFLDHSAGRAIDFSSDGFIRENMEKIISQEDYSEVQKTLNSHLTNNKLSLDPEMYGINIIDLDGNIIASTADSEIGKNESADEYFAEAKKLNYGQAYISDIAWGYHFGSLDKLCITISAPLMDLKGDKKIGILVTYITTDKINDFLRDNKEKEVLRIVNGVIDLGAGLKTYLVNKDRLIIASSGGLGDDLLRKKMESNLVERCTLKSEQQSKIFSDSYINQDGVRVSGAANCFSGNWVLLAEIAESEIYGALAKLKLVILFTCLLIVFIVFIIIQPLARGIIGPVRKLSESVKKMGEGDLSQRAEVTSDDEIGQLAKAFNEMAEKLEETDRSKSEFVSLASHQLLTPLTTIRWSIEVLLSGGQEILLSGAYKRSLEDMHRINQNMIELVRALLDVSRIELGTFSIEPEPAKISEVIDGVFMELAPKIESKKLEVKKEYDETVPVMNIDTNLFRIIFQNLLTNAVKYTPDGGRVIIKISRDGENVVLRVSDSGCGIPYDQQSKVFSKFFRGDNVKQKKIDGTGLGLYIVKSIVDHSGGKIWFESEEDKGTTFYVSYPLIGMRAKEGTKKIGE